VVLLFLIAINSLTHYLTC